MGAIACHRDKSRTPTVPTKDITSIATPMRRLIPSPLFYTNAAAPASSFGLRTSRTTAKVLKPKSGAAIGGRYCSRADSAGRREPTVQLRVSGKLWYCLGTTPETDCRRLRRRRHNRPSPKVSRRSRIGPRDTRRPSKRASPTGRINPDAFTASGPCNARAHTTPTRPADR